MNSDKWHPTTSCTSWPQSQAVFDTGAPDWPRLKQGKRRIPYLPETNQNLRLGRIVSLQEVSFPAQLIGNVVIAMVVSLSWVCFWITQNFMSFSTKLSHLGCKSSYHFESFNWIVVKYSTLPTSKSLQIGRVFKFSRHVLSTWVQIKMLQASFLDPLQETSNYRNNMAIKWHSSSGTPQSANICRHPLGRPVGKALLGIIWSPAKARWFMGYQVPMRANIR